MKSISLKLKSVVAVAALAMGVSVMAPQKAEAGIILLFAGSNSGVPVFVTGFGIDTVVFIAAQSTSNPSRQFRETANAWWRVGGALMILDANGAVSQDSLVRDFSNKYSFIDNAAVAQSFGQLAKAKLDAARTAQPEAKNWTVNFSASETAALLAPAAESITPAQAAQVAKDLE